MRSLSDFWSVVASKAVHPAYRDHRYGQIVFNTLYAFKPMLASMISAEHPDLDPYHMDLEAIAASTDFVAFCDFLTNEWEKW